MSLPTARSAQAAAVRRGRLLGVGLDLAVKLQDDGAAAVRSDLAKMASTDTRDLALCMLACIDVEQPVTGILAAARDLLGIAVPARPQHQNGGRSLNPCGTRAAAVRHRTHGEVICEPCRAAERAYDSAAKRARRRRVKGSESTPAAHSPPSSPKSLRLAT